MKKFITTGYEILTKKIKDSRGVRFVMLTDLHGLSFGEENRLLLEEIDRLKPDAVLITGYDCEKRAFFPKTGRNADKTYCKQMQSLLFSWKSRVQTVFRRMLSGRISGV